MSAAGALSRPGRSSGLEVAPIGDSDLNAVCDFWQQKFRAPWPMEVWQQAFRHDWAPRKPNNGFMLRRKSEIVGALGAIYSNQAIGGRTESFCNMTGWYVAEEHRSRSLDLLLHLIRQEGLTFTNFSPTPRVEEVLLRLGFTALPKDGLEVPNQDMPAGLSSSVQVLDDPAAIAEAVSPERRKICLDHAGCQPTSQLALGTGQDGYCHVMLSFCRRRDVPRVIVQDIGAPQLLARFWQHFASYALRRSGAKTTRIEARLLDRATLPLSVPMTNRTGGLFLSRTLPAGAISRRYSEIMALSGC